jgi:predicted ester cyclase
MIKSRALIVPLGILLLVVGLSACGGSEDSKDNKEVVTRFVQEFKNNANHGIVDELMTPGFTHHLTDPRLTAGRDGLKLVGQAVVGGFPDVQATVQDLLADGDRVIERTAVRATHTGEFNGIPATGRAVTWTEIHIYRLEDGKIAELWSEIDFLGLLVQLGVVPGP